MGIKVRKIERKLVYTILNAADLAIGQDGTITGSLNVAPFMTGAGAVVVALGAMWAIKKVISLLR